MSLDPSVPILIVDDDALDVESVQRVLKKADCANPCMVCSNALDALEALCNDPLIKDAPQILVLLDLNMPGLDGSQLLDFLCETPTFSRYKIVVHSTSTAPSDKQLVDEHKLAGYIEKPFSMEKLEACLNPAAS